MIRVGLNELKYEIFFIFGLIKMGSVLEPYCASPNWQMHAWTMRHLCVGLCFVSHPLSLSLREIWYIAIWPTKIIQHLRIKKFQTSSFFFSPLKCKLNMIQSQILQWRKTIMVSVLSINMLIFYSWFIY